MLQEESCIQWRKDRNWWRNELMNEEVEKGRKYERKKLRKEEIDQAKTRGKRNLIKEKGEATEEGKTFARK